MAKLGNLTKSMSGKVGSLGATVGLAPFKAVGSIVSSSYNGAKKGLKSAASNALDLGALRPTNILHGALESVGLGGLIMAGSGGKNKSGSADRNYLASQQKSGASFSTATLEHLVMNLIDINQKVLSNTNELVDFAKKQKNALEEANDLARQKALSDLEARRENVKSNPKAANDNKAGAEKQGGKGILGTILGIAGGIAGFFADLMKTTKEIVGGVLDLGKKLLGFFEGIFSFLKTGVLALIEIAEKIFPYIKKFVLWVGRLFVTMGEFLIANPIVAAIALAVAAIASLKAADWAKFFDGFTKIFTDLAEGKFLDAIIRTVTAIPGLIITALGRLLANILDFFGFKETAKAIDDFLDKFDFPQLVVDAVHAVIDYIADFFSDLPEIIGKAIDSLGSMLSDIGTWIMDSGKVVGDFFVSVKDWVVAKFTDATKVFSDWWNSFSVIDPILNTFGSIKGWIIEKFENATKSFSEWWDSFSLIDILLSPFNYIKDKAVSLFDDLKKEISDILSFDLVGNISKSISSVINSVWNFFKALPGKAMDLVGSFVPDSLKSLWNSFFGSNSTVAENNVTPSSNSGRDQTFNQQSARMASSQSAPPVIVVNNNGGSNLPQPQSQTPRNYGAVQTAPQDSHIDRALYGNHYGAGVA